VNAFSQGIFLGDLKPKGNRLPDVRQRFLVGLALALATRQRRATHRIALVRLDEHHAIFHAFSLAGC
jgi:hypothetical protein